MIKALCMYTIFFIRRAFSKLIIGNEKYNKFCPGSSDSAQNLIGLLGFGGIILYAVIGYQLIATEKVFIEVLGALWLVLVPTLPVVYRQYKPRIHGNSNEEDSPAQVLVSKVKASCECPLVEGSDFCSYCGTKVK